MDILTDNHLVGTQPDTGSTDTISRQSRQDFLPLHSRLDAALHRIEELETRNKTLLQECTETRQ